MSLNAQFFSAMDQQMIGAGYKRTAKGQYDQAVSEDVSARLWVYTTLDRSSGALSATPSFGVVSKSAREVERECVGVVGMEPARFTLGLPVGYKGMQTHKPWYINDEAEVDDVATGIREHFQLVGRPFVDEYSGLEAILAAYAENVEWDFSYHTLKTLAIAFATDAKGAGRSMLGQAEKALAEPTFVERERMRNFLDCLGRRL
jgi:hypothetical protein